MMALRRGLLVAIRSPLPAVSYPPDLVKSWEIEDTQLRVIGDVLGFNSAQIWSKKSLERIILQNEVPKVQRSECP